MENSRFGNRIKELRQQAGLNQRVVARLVGIDFSYLSKIEKGLVVPAREVILKLAEVLSGSTDELLTLAGKLPSDIIEQLHNNPAMLKSLRNGRVGKSRAGAVNGTSFGRTLKELREKAGMSQSELADELGISFTYLSKIENGIRPAPSEKLIYRLAEILHADSDELLAISGKVPAEVVGRLQNEKTMHALRSAYIKNMDRRDGVMHKLKSLFSLQGLTRVALPVVLVAAVAASLVFSAPMPVKAVDFTFGGSTSVTTGNAMTFTVKIDVKSGDILPIVGANVLFSDKAGGYTTYQSAFTGLPLNTTASAVTLNSVAGTSSSLSVEAVTAANWGYADLGGAGRQGYGYNGATWGTHSFTGNTGYGYSSGSYNGPTSITYTITWTPPSSWPAGTYYINASISGDGSTQLYENTPFTISAAAPPSGPYVPPASTTQPEETTPGTWDVTDTVTNTGTFTTTVTVQDENDEVSVKIDAGTVGTTTDNETITEIAVDEVAPETLPEPPAAITGKKNVLVMTYDINVNGGKHVEFSKPITLTFKYDPALIPEGVAETDLVVAWYDEVAGQWVELPTTVNTVTKTLTVQVTHLSKWAVMATVTEPAVEEPVVDEPVVDEPVVDEPVVDEPVVDEPVVDEPVVDEPVVDEPVDEEPAPTAGIAWWVWLIIGLAVVAAAAVAYIYWWKPNHAA